MFRHSVLGIFLICCGTINGALTFQGLTYSPIVEKPAPSSGLDELYVLYSTHDVTAAYATQNSGVRVYKFSSLGGGYAQEIPTTNNAGNIMFSIEPNDMGYIVEDGTSRQCYWITDYSRHMYQPESIIKSNDSDCATMAITFAGNADKITFYSINGAPLTLSRDIKMCYQTMEYDAERDMYTNVETEVKFDYLTPTLHIPASLCTTDFELIGDRFLEHWGLTQGIRTPIYEPWAVSASTKATQSEHTADNEQQSGIAGLGGSAPCEIEFTAAVTEAAIFTQWQIATDNQFENIQRRFNETGFTYTFNEQGNLFVRFVAGNNDGSCEYIGETYEISIGESSLLCPNAFSPGATPGINDEWKISYKSIISFECHIFNRWGQKMAELRSPDQGWDGKYKGKTVPAGVYYYVIKASGSDGRQYNLSGDINIINYSNSQVSSSPNN